MHTYSAHKYNKLIAESKNTKFVYESSKPTGSTSLFLPTTIEGYSRSHPDRKSG